VGRSMRLVLIVPTFGRKALLTRMLSHLETQTRAPDEVIVSAPDETHVEPYQPRLYKLTYVFGARGSSSQRNKALEAALGNCDIVVFFDDDFLPADSYLEKAEASLRDKPDWKVITGRVVRDGIKGIGLSFEEGLAMLRDTDHEAILESEITEQHGAYGCNMSMRARDIGTLRFDERLPLYGWQEDTDFSRQVASHGRIVQLGSLRGVHLGVKNGRVSGVRFGYSQIANPVYLVRKGTIPARIAASLMAKNLAANLLGSVWPEPYIDRFGRLKGNALAAYHVLRGRVEPEFILRL
jgi:glycosyltransferase involved in cell wall biosynthesis